MIRCVDCVHCMVMDDYLRCDACNGGEVSCYVAHGGDICRENAEPFGGDDFFDEFMDIVAERGVPDCPECVYSFGENKDDPELGERCLINGSPAGINCEDMFMGRMCLCESRPSERVSWRWN